MQATTWIGTETAALRAFYASGKTRPQAFRRAALKALEGALRKHEEALLSAMHADMRKPRFEAYTSDVGLVYAVTVTAVKVHVLMTMTSAACPVTDVIIDDVQAELDRVVPADMKIEVEICWEPPWTPDRMSERARQMMQW